MPPKKTAAKKAPAKKKGASKSDEEKVIRVAVAGGHVGTVPYFTRESGRTIQDLLDALTAEFPETYEFQRRATTKTDIVLIPAEAQGRLVGANMKVWPIGIWLETHQKKPVFYARLVRDGLRIPVVRGGDEAEERASYARLAAKGHDSSATADPRGRRIPGTDSFLESKSTGSRGSRSRSSSGSRSRSASPAELTHVSQSGGPGRGRFFGTGGRKNEELGDVLWPLAHKLGYVFSRSPNLDTTIILRPDDVAKASVSALARTDRDKKVRVLPISEFLETIGMTSQQRSKAGLR